ncbi:HAD family hydrolase [Hahella sp. CR1]|uniref:HAD family hydrolase n=1 Tax=Hahella sp. CR1 TaxID=2992807 RepID=UPI002441D802|nr:HAD family hydrolase [Hahella sp. CR1]MDG9672334.1 HAD family hydrolase [Hahella sp. CR1]
MSKLLITDLDNTLYDWIFYFSQSFESLLNGIQKVTGINRYALLNDFKKVHQKYKNSERPYASLELDSLISYFGTDDKKLIEKELDIAFSQFSEKRRKTLKLYPGVLETLDKLKAHGVKIVGHTESYEVNSVYRAKKLGLDKYLSHLYTICSTSSSHPNDRKPILDDCDMEWVVRLPESERKPNPRLVLDICEREGVSTKDTYYVGDSIAKDISMANAAGVNSVWAKYGRNIAKSDWSLLVSITHWTDEDVKREELLEGMYSNERPKYELSSFSDLQLILID